MFEALNGSPQTNLSTDLSSSSTSAYVDELGDVDGLITIWTDETTYETCEVSGKSAASGPGTMTISRTGDNHSSSASNAALAWSAGAKVARNPTGRDHNIFKNNIEDLASRSITAGVGLSGGGDMTEDMTLALDLTELEAVTTPEPNDYIPIVRSSGHKRITRKDFLGGHGSVYGLLWNRSSSSQSLQRIDENGDALSLTATDFNNHPLWGGMKRCTLTAAGVPTYGTNNRGDGLTLTNDYVMVECPLAYAGAYREGDYQGILLSDAQFSSKYCSSERHHAFWKRTRTGERATKLYLGAYEAGASGGTTVEDGATNTLYATNRTGLKLTSKSGVKCLTGYGTDGTMAQMEASANAIGSGWGIESYWSRALIQALFYIEHGTFNSQSAIGPGRTNAENTSALDTGGADALMNTIGTGGGTDLQAVAYRGLENPWGNVWEFIIGLNVVDTEIRVMKKDGTGALADTLTDYQATSGIIPLNGSTNLGGGTDAGVYTHGYVKDLIFADPLKLGFFPSVLGGSESTYLTDYFYSHQDTQTNILLAGGGWSAAGFAGVGCLGANGAAVSVGPYFGSRLEFIL